jgi:O-acetyl-ADP-ribose deacetylase (regulator of RNase III)
MTTIEVVLGDITAENVDAIVTAANESLLGGGGVDGAIHGPVWEDGRYGEAEVLASCYRRCLAVADELGARSVAFPAIATGVYGFPPEQAARIAVGTLRSTPTQVAQIRLVAFDQETRDLLRAALAA